MVRKQFDLLRIESVDIRICLIHLITREDYVNISLEEQDQETMGNKDEQNSIN